MKILLVNKYNYPTGGADIYCFALRDVLKSKGNDVAEFCIDCPENLYSHYKNYFVFGVTSKNWESASTIKSIKTFLYSIYNFEAKEKFDRLLENFKPDIIHIQNIFYQISPSILSAAAKKGIPVVETLHDYHLICANNNFYHHGNICEDCLTQSRLSIIKNRCYNDSLKASLLVFISFMFRKVFGNYENRIYCWICPSRFLYNKMVTNGVNSQKLRLVSNFIQSDEFDGEQIKDDGFILFLGRVEKQKGIWTLVKAAEVLREMKFVVAGEGSVRKEIANYISLKDIKNIELLGFVKPEDLKTLIQSSRLIVVPSEWYEVFGLVILEAFKYGKPVIASEIGGIPEIIGHDAGILYNPGNILQFIKSIKDLYNNKVLRKNFVKNAQAKLVKEYGIETHYNIIMNIYQEAINNYGKSK